MLKREKIPSNFHKPLTLVVFFRYETRRQNCSSELTTTNRNDSINQAEAENGFKKYVTFIATESIGTYCLSPGKVCVAGGRRGPKGTRGKPGAKGIIGPPGKSGNQGI